jgi:hypothetical protein
MRAAIVTCLAMLLVTWVSPMTSSGASAPGDELPEGAGKSILQAKCTTCHTLGELPKFRSYNRAEWRNLIVTMRDYGAKLEEPEIDILADYLVEHFGTRD